MSSFQLDLLRRKSCVYQEAENNTLNMDHKDRNFGTIPFQSRNLYNILDHQTLHLATLQRPSVVVGWAASQTHCQVALEGR